MSAVSAAPAKANAKPGRNDPCPCGSGRKFKLCCGQPAPSRQTPAPPPPPAPRPSRDVASHIARARQLAGAGDLQAALGAVWHAIRADEHNAVAHIDCGVIHLRMGHVDEAVRMLRRATLLAPDSALARHRLGAALERSADEQGAIAAYRRAVSLSPGLQQAHARLGALLLASGQDADAREALVRAAACGRGTPEGQLSQA